MTTTVDHELFDGTAYQIPFPKADGKDVNELVVRLAGSLKLDRNNPEHTQLVEAMTLGRFLTLTVTATVDSKGQSIRYDSDDNETVTHAVGLKLHSADPA